MGESIRQFISECANSTIGRFVFVGYFVYIVSMIAFAYGHFPYLTYPYRFYGERELFEIMNAPQLEFIRSVRLVFRWQASKFTDVLAAAYIALPWWVYGYLFELIVKRIADTSVREMSADELSRLTEAERHRLGDQVPAVESFCDGPASWSSRFRSADVISEPAVTSSTSNRCPHTDLRV